LEEEDENKNYFIFYYHFLLLIFISNIINIPADQPTIQAGINVAVDGDTVLVQPDIYIENINYDREKTLLLLLYS